MIQSLKIKLSEELQEYNIKLSKETEILQGFVGKEGLQDSKRRGSFSKGKGRITKSFGRELSWNYFEPKN